MLNFTQVREDFHAARIFCPRPLVRRASCVTSQIRRRPSALQDCSHFNLVAARYVRGRRRARGRRGCGYAVLWFFLIVVLSGFARISTAEEVAVFGLAWGKGKQRNVRSFAVALDSTAAAYTAYNFKKLVRDKFYVKTTLHRVIPNYLVQGGDPLSKHKDRDAVGTGGPGYTLPAEIRLPHIRGSIAMGRLADPVNPNRRSNGSQFYICLRAMPEQDRKDTVFGHVISGLPALDEISRLPTDTNSNPVERVVITRTYLIDRSALWGERSAIANGR